MRKLILAFIASLLIIGCTDKSRNAISYPNRTEVHNDKFRKPLSAIEKACLHAGLIDIRTLDTNIAVELKYATADNFMHCNMYGNFHKAYLQKDVAEKLVQAQKYLNELIADYRLIIYDAVRPRSVQQKMWDTLKIPFYDKIKFLSNPKFGSLHNFGAAVDISILDDRHHPLDMGTPFDYEGELAYPEDEAKLLKEGKLSVAQINNRKLLRKVMYKAGFFNIETEWWHFNSCTLEQALGKYKIIE
jgi:D-alanyl-D-alanine dipeptidase